MIVLGLESSCDETAAAVIDGSVILSSVIRSQIDLHKQYGGVVPEIASRAHLESIDLVANEALKQAGLTLDKLDGLAVTQGPGLVGALLVAISFAKGLSISTNLPLTGVNHVKAHALSPFMHELNEEKNPKPQFPLIALVASGGHTSLYLMESYLSFTLLGQTRDDAAGEAFDKTAKLMGLGYPGGQIIEQLASKGDKTYYNITRPMLHDGLDFSFSGLKTKIWQIYNKENMAKLPLDHIKYNHLAASFQEAALEVLEKKLLKACEIYQAKGAVLAGGVAANSSLRARLEKSLALKGLAFYTPHKKWCSDNAAMIANLGHRQFNEPKCRLDLKASAIPRWPVS